MDFIPDFLASDDVEKLNILLEEDPNLYVWNSGIGGKGMNLTWSGKLVKVDRALNGLVQTLDRDKAYREFQ